MALIEFRALKDGFAGGQYRRKGSVFLHEEGLAGSWVEPASQPEPPASPAPQPETFDKFQVALEASNNLAGDKAKARTTRDILSAKNDGNDLV